MNKIYHFVMLSIFLFLIWVMLPNLNVDFTGVDKNKDFLFIVLIIVLVILLGLLFIDIKLISSSSSTLTILKNRWIYYLIIFSLVVIASIGIVIRSFNMLYAGTLATFTMSYYKSKINKFDEA